MIRPAEQVIALVPLHPDRRGASLDAPFGGTSVLGHTLLRLARCRRLDRIALIHERGARLPVVPHRSELRQRCVFHAVESMGDPAGPMRHAARAFSPTAWRGGLGGASCYDEPLAAGPMHEALGALDAAAGLIVGPDWPLVDPTLCDAVVERHLAEPAARKLVFTQAPPGLAGCVVHRDLLGELAGKRATIGSVLDYQPHKPQPDPIGKDPCVQVPAAVRGAPGRAVFDAPRWRRLLRAVEAECADPLQADAESVARSLAAHRELADRPTPQQETVSITRRRAATGPIVPPEAVAAEGAEIAADEMEFSCAVERFAQLAAEPDAALTLGGPGDPLLHEGWDRLIEAAHEAGIDAVHVETDLLVDEPALRRLLELPVDVLSVRLHADSAATYQKVMGVDGFDRVVGNIDWLLRHRDERGAPGLPWIVPRFSKTEANLDEMPAFFDRWTGVCGHAVIDPPPAHWERPGVIRDLSPQGQPMTAG